MTRPDSSGPDVPGLKPRQISLIRESFKWLLPIRQTTATLFYAHLFEIAPSVRPLFSSRDLAEHGDMFMATLDKILLSLDHMQEIEPVLEALAIRHLGYGAQERHYSAVGEALIWALEQGSAERFTDEIRVAWIDAYAEFSQIMIAAAYCDRTIA